MRLSLFQPRLRGVSSPGASTSTPHTLPKRGVVSTPANQHRMHMSNLLAVRHSRFHGGPALMHPRLGAPLQSCRRILRCVTRLLALLAEQTVIRLRPARLL